MDILKAPAPLATFLLRIPLSVMFFQQGFAKYNGNMGLEAEMWNLPYIVWWFVTFGEIGAAIGLLVGGLIGVMPWHRWFSEFMQTIIWNLGDLLTRFSAITMTCVVTGVLWLMKPASLLDVILYDYLHVSLYVVALYFALRGNVKYGV
tara:strand:+ start:37243 stop:37686 length:444 start_codon:yes stop_codon:yes gene_type:complete